MNVIEQAQQAYAPTHAPIRTDRAIEAQLISKVTSLLHQAKSAQPTNFTALVSAVHENRRMWVTLATGVADDDNKLSPTLRAQLFYLAEFTEHHSRLVLQRSATVDALIDINTAVIRGLNSREAA